MTNRTDRMDAEEEIIKQTLASFTRGKLWRKGRREPVSQSADADAGFW